MQISVYNACTSLSYSIQGYRKFSYIWRMGLDSTQKIFWNYHLIYVRAIESFVPIGEWF